MSLLEMSLTGGIMVLAVAVLRALLLNRLPKRTFVLLWEIAMLRLLLPVYVPSILSVYTFFDRAGGLAHNVSTPTASIKAPVITDVLIEGNYAAALPVREIETAGVSVPVRTVVWAVGMTLFLAYFVIGYARVFRKYRCSTLVNSGYPVEWLSEQGIRRRVRICISDQARTPLTYGVFRPTILLPESVGIESSERLAYILAHEMTHIRRFDMVRKIAAALVLSVHWFNPLAWVLFALYNRDIELACDEEVVRKSGGDCRSAYALALIGMEEERRKHSLFSHFSRNTAEERIVAIMKIKKVTAGAAAAACAAVLGVTGAFATTSASFADKPDPDITVADKVILSNGENGEKYYSLDGGNSDEMLVQAVPVGSDTENRGGTLGGWADVTREELLERYGAFGITFDGDEKMLYNGETVRFFCDGCEVDDGGWATRYACFNAEGAVDVYTVYEAAPNGDGSVDPFGKLVGLRKASKEEFDMLHTAFTAYDEISQGAYVLTPSTFETDKNFSEAVTIADGSAVSDGKSFESIFARYREYGIEYKAAPTGLGNVYYNGELVKHFSDVSPNGSAFSFESADGGEITVSVEYDESGNVSGVRKHLFFSF